MVIKSSALDEKKCRVRTLHAPGRGTCCCSLGTTRLRLQTCASLLPSLLGQGSVAHPPDGATAKEPNIHPLYHQHRPGDSILEPATLGPLGWASHSGQSLSDSEHHFQGTTGRLSAQGWARSESRKRTREVSIPVGLSPLGASFLTRQCVTFCVPAAR